jgi:hypothetical protein
LLSFSLPSKTVEEKRILLFCRGKPGTKEAPSGIVRFSNTIPRGWLGALLEKENPQVLVLKHVTSSDPAKQLQLTCRVQKINKT